METSRRSFGLAVGLAGLVFAAEDPRKLRTLEDVTILTPAGPFVLSSLRLKNKSFGRPITLTGLIENRTGRYVHSGSIDVGISHSGPDAITGSPILMGFMEAGATKSMTYTITGKVDFSSLAFRFAISGIGFPVTHNLVMERPMESRDLHFEDATLVAVFKFERTGVNIGIKNKGDQVIRLIWDESAYIDESGQSRKIAHSGVKYVDRNSSQPPSVIPPGASFSDTLFPTDAVYYAERAGWTHNAILPEGPAGLRMPGKTVGLFLPIQVGQEKRDLSFSFKILSSN